MLDDGLSEFEMLEVTFQASIAKILVRMIMNSNEEFESKIFSQKTQTEAIKLSSSLIKLTESMSYFIYKSKRNATINILKLYIF